MGRLQDAVLMHGSRRAAAKALGVADTTFRDQLKKELSLETPINPMVITGVSTLRNRDGEVVAEWIKQNLDKDLERDAREAAIYAMCAQIVPAEIIPGPLAVKDNLLTLYNFFDYHVGMLAWHKEGGADWDLQIAEQVGINAMTMLVDGAPGSSEAVINIGGDFLHFDGLLPVTPTSGHVLDADSRFGKVVDIAIKMIRQLVNLALTKHAHVRLLVMEGNHDLSSSLWLRKLFAALYENEDRVTVHESELPYYAIEWGINMLGFHHGHLKKNEQLPALFAAMFRSMWGRCA